MDPHDVYLSYFNDFIKTPEQGVFPIEDQRHYDEVVFRHGDLVARMSGNILGLLVDSQPFHGAFCFKDATAAQLDAYKALQRAVVRVMPLDMWRAFVTETLDDPDVEFDADEDGLRITFCCQCCARCRRSDSWRVTRDAFSGAIALRVSVYVQWDNIGETRPGEDFWVRTDIPLSLDQAQTICGVVQDREKATLEEADARFVAMNMCLSAILYVD